MLFLQRFVEKYKDSKPATSNGVNATANGNSVKS